MKGVVRFRQGDRVLMSMDFPLDAADHILEFAAAAHAEFRSRHPEVSLFDENVIVEWDKADEKAEI